MHTHNFTCNYFLKWVSKKEHIEMKPDVQYYIPCTGVRREHRRTGGERSQADDAGTRELPAIPRVPAQPSHEKQGPDAQRPQSRRVCTMAAGSTRGIVGRQESERFHRRLPDSHAEHDWAETIDNVSRWVLSKFNITQGSVSCRSATMCTSRIHTACSFLSNTGCVVSWINTIQDIRTDSPRRMTPIPMHPYTRTRKHFMQLRHIRVRQTCSYVNVFTSYCTLCLLSYATIVSDTFNLLSVLCEYEVGEVWRCRILNLVLCDVYPT